MSDLDYYLSATDHALAMGYSVLLIIVGFLLAWCAYAIIRKYKDD
jgi:hypothetical protein